MNLDRTLRLAQTYVDKAQRELAQTRSLSSQYNQRMRDLQGIIQRRNLFDESGLNTDDGLAILDLDKLKDDLIISQNELAVYLTTALTFVVESMNYMVNIDDKLNVSQNRLKIRSIVRNVQSVISDPISRNIPKDGISVSIVRGETIARLADSSVYFPIRDLFKNLRLSIDSYSTRC